VVLDEPTATLPENEVRHLLQIVRRVAETGVGVLYVTHRLDEVFEVADNVTVFRDGLRVATQPTSTLNRRSLINLLIGSELEEIHAESEHLHSEHGDPILHVRDLVSGPVAGVSLEVRPGDVLGIAGITGSGRETLLPAIFGAQPREGGTITVNGNDLKAQRPDLAMGMGLAYLPPDRKIQGGIMEFTARENMVISDLKPFWHGLRLRGRQEVAETKKWFQRLGVRPVDGVNLRLSAFSGGNQQKVLFGKWLRRTPLILLLDEPTQGVDVGAKAELHRQLLAAAEAGAGLVISTSDLDELVALSHRVLVLRDGRIVADLRGEAVTVANVARESLGAEGKVVAA
jgi:ribose transport system ATP-binding protein